MRNNDSPWAGDVSTHTAVHTRLGAAMYLHTPQHILDVGRRCIYTHRSTYSTWGGDVSTHTAARTRRGAAMYLHTPQHVLDVGRRCIQTHRSTYSTWGGDVSIHTPQHVLSTTFLSPDYREKNLL